MIKGHWSVQKVLSTGALRTIRTASSQIWKLRTVGRIWMQYGTERKRKTPEGAFVPGEPALSGEARCLLVDRAYW